MWSEHLWIRPCRVPPMCLRGVRSRGAGCPKLLTSTMACLCACVVPCRGVRTATVCSDAFVVTMLPSASRVSVPSVGVRNPPAPLNLTRCQVPAIPRRSARKLWQWLGHRSLYQRKEKENSSLNGKIEDEQTLGGKLNTQIKELQARLDELDEELEGERAARARADKGRGQLRRELDELHEKLEETGSNTAAQIALNTRREEELAKLKMELDESNITHESTLAMLRQKHNSSISEMGDQIDSLNKLKAKAEKERNGVALELEEAQNQMGNEQNERQNLEKQMDSRYIRKTERQNLEKQMEELEALADEIHRDRLTAFGGLANWQANGPWADEPT